MHNELPEGDADMSETATLEANSGGRVRFNLGTEVRYIEIHGAISQEIYVIDQERSDRKGHISLKEKDGTRTLRVHHRRLLPVDMTGKAVVIESQDKLWALCPEDGMAVEVSPGDTEMVCPKCSKTFTLYWIGVKPMADATKTSKTKEKEEKTPKVEKAEKAAPKPKAEKPAKEPKAVKEAIKVDLPALVKLKHCELWTKKNVKFDHERIDVQAHVLLFTGDNPRKLCFNTYNSTLGKKATSLPIEEFIANEPVKGAGQKKDTPWFTVTDLEKARQQLQKGGYEQQQK